MSKQKNEISARQIGRNIIIIADGQQYSKSFADKADRDNILGKVKKYNEKNTVKALKDIIKTMNADKKERKAKTEAVKKKTVVKVKKPKEAKQSVKKEVVKKVEEVKKEEKKYEPIPATTSRSGRREW